MEYNKDYKKYVDFVASRKYLQKGETLEGMTERVSSSIINKAKQLYGSGDINVKRLESKLPSLMKSMAWLPGGSIIASLGINTNEVNSLANCTVYFNTSDSYSGISKNEEAIRNLCKRRCGIGQDISHYRPHLANVNNSAKSSNGLTSRMESMSNVTLEVAQNGRRGALMITCSINHPDVLDVIRYKGDDLNRCQGANISIMITDEFYNQLINSPESKWIMTYPITYKPTKDERIFIESSKEGELVTLPSGNYAKWYPIKLIWDTFVDYNIKGAEPGCINIDTMRKSASNVYPGGRIVSSNPCLTGDTLVEMGDGEYKKIIDIKVGDIVMSYNHATKSKEPKKVTWSGKTRENAEVISLNLKYGSLKCTPDHKLWNPDLEEYVEAKNIDTYLRDDLCWECVRGITEIESQDVYDISVEDNHNFFTDLCLVHNCGEIPLPIGDSCRLSSINLAEYPDLLSGNYEDDIKCMLFASDVLIDIDYDYTKAILNKLANENIDGMLSDEIAMWKVFLKNNREFRRNGFGFTGLADWLAMNKVTYGSDDSIKLVGKLAAYICKITSEYSVELAKSYGPFKSWKYELERNVKYVKDNFESIKDYKTYGRRWVTALTVAPNGTLSILTGTTSGVEPLFAKEYLRKVLGETIKITHPRITNKNSVYYIEAKDIKFRNKVKLIAEIQKYWDNSISTTYNLPSNITHEEVSNLYIDSWKLGNKGMTIYVDGSRDAVLTDVKSEVDTEGCLVFERPEYLECDVHHFDFNGEAWVAFVGKNNGRLWEIFLGKEDEDRFLPKSITTGWLRKVKVNQTSVSRYDFRFKDKYGYYNFLGGINHIFDKELWNYGRFISALMRVSTPVQLYHIVNKLYENNDNIHSWKSNLLRVIKYYINEGEELFERCDECGGRMIKRDGCLTCESCGIQKCS